MAFDLTALSTYTDELSLELIAKAVLTTDLMEEIDVRSGLSAGTVAINLMDGDLNVADLACGWNPSGDVNFSQVDITIRDKQVKMELCPEDLRQYWISQRMAASAHAEEVPFAETIASYYVERVKKYNETFLISGDGTADGGYDGCYSRLAIGSGVINYTQIAEMANGFNTANGIVNAPISVNDINLVIGKGGPNGCLLNLPDPSTILSPAVCGNAILEGDEECDCGTIAVSHAICS